MTTNAGGSRLGWPFRNTGLRWGSGLGFGTTVATTNLGYEIGGLTTAGTSPVDVIARYFSVAPGRIRNSSAA